MRSRRVRFTVRRMMVAVAVVAVGLGIRAQLARRHKWSRFYEIKAARLERSVTAYRGYAAISHEQWLADCRDVGEVNRKGGETWGPRRYMPEPAFARRMAVHWGMIAQKYHRAATEPWWPVEPDPPPPNP
jgi:hypothetical protein